MITFDRNTQATAASGSHLRAPIVLRTFINCLNIANKNLPFIQNGAPPTELIDIRNRRTPSVIDVTSAEGPKSSPNQTLLLLPIRRILQLGLNHVVHKQNSLFEVG